MRDIAGAVGIVTGASRGVGPFIARELSRAGVRIALVARSIEGLRNTASTITETGEAAPLIIPADISDTADQERVVDTVCRELGAPRLLVNNAGVEYLTPFQDASVERLRNVILVNLFGTEAMTRLVLPHMTRTGSGHIVFIGSVGGRTAYPFGAVNCSTKHGLVGFAWSLREELRGTGVGVSAVYPTLIDRVGISSRWQAGKRPAMVGHVTPEAVAAAVLDCVRRNRVEVTIASPMERVADVLGAISPRFTAWAARTGGVYRFLRRAAEAQAADTGEATTGGSEP